MKNILVFDTETTGEFGQPLIYDFGYKIISPSGQVLHMKNALVREIFESRFLMDKAYYSQKVKTYQEMVVNHEIDVEPFHKIIREFIAATRKYKVEIILVFFILQ